MLIRSFSPVICRKISALGDKGRKILTDVQVRREELKPCVFFSLLGGGHRARGWTRLNAAVVRSKNSGRNAFCRAAEQDRGGHHRGLLGLFCLRAGNGGHRPGHPRKTGLNCGANRMTGSGRCTRSRGPTRCRQRAAATSVRWPKPGSSGVWQTGIRTQAIRFFRAEQSRAVMLGLSNAHIFFGGRWSRKHGLVVK